MSPLRQIVKKSSTARHLLRNWSIRVVMARHLSPNAAMFLFGCALLVIGMNGVASAQDGVQFNDAEIRQAVCDLFSLIEGAFGALIMTVAGIGAIVSASMGAYRAGTSLLFTGCGAFILRSLVSLYFAPVTTCTGSELIPDP